MPEKSKTCLAKKKPQSFIREMPPEESQYFRSRFVCKIQQRESARERMYVRIFVSSWYPGLVPEIPELQSVTFEMHEMLPLNGRRNMYLQTSWPIFLPEKYARYVATLCMVIIKKKKKCSSHCPAHVCSGIYMKHPGNERSGDNDE